MVLARGFEIVSCRSLQGPLIVVPAVFGSGQIFQTFGRSMFAPSEMLLGGQNGLQMQFRIIFPHPFTARIRTARCWGPGFRNFGPKKGQKRVKNLVQLWIQNGDHFWPKMGVTFGPKWVQLLVQIGGNFGSRMEATLDPKWAPLWPQNGSHRIFLNIVKCAR